MNEQDRFMPDPNRIGLLTSTVLVALVFVRLIPAGGFNLAVQFPGFLFDIPLNLSTLLGLLTAGLTATGMDWLIRSHPTINKRPTFQWWILPTLTTFVISVPLNILPNGQAWLIGFLVSGLFLFFVFLAEYIVVDADAPHYTISVVGLTAISYTLFFILTIALRTSGVRLYILLPSLFFAASLASLRILHLSTSSRWEIAWSAGIGLVCMQLAAGLHYWPLSPVQFGLLTIGPMYSLINLATSMNENTSTRRAITNAVIATGICWGLAIFIR